MPIRLNWLRGRNFGLGMIFLGVIGLTQVIFIIIAQYGLQIGSADLVTLIPIGVTLALFYSIVIIFESNTFMTKYRETRSYGSKKNKEEEVSRAIIWIFARPIVIVVVVFVIFFLGHMRFCFHF